MLTNGYTIFQLLAFIFSPHFSIIFTFSYHYFSASIVLYFPDSSIILLYFPDSSIILYFPYHYFFPLPLFFSLISLLQRELKYLTNENEHATDQ